MNIRRMTVVVNERLMRSLLVVIGLCLISTIQQTALASPFGQGEFGAQVPFGSATSISIAVGGNVTLSLTPSGSNFTASSSGSITVASTDVVGYSLYIYSPGTSSLTNGTSSIPASGNTSEAPLSANTWGYNVDGSTNYIGMTTSPVVLTSLSGPYESGNTTNVTYSALTDITTAEGSYAGTVTYTAVALMQ